MVRSGRELVVVNRSLPSARTCSQHGGAVFASTDRSHEVCPCAARASVRRLSPLASRWGISPLPLPPQMAFRGRKLLVLSPFPADRLEESGYGAPR
jgi:hypothetical protein